MNIDRLESYATAIPQTEVGPLDPSAVPEFFAHPDFTEIQPKVQGFLECLVLSPQVHGKYLNMLSYIEHLGSRYLLLTHTKDSLNGPVLKHYMEEVRHSYALRRMAEKILGQSLSYVETDMLVRASASQYMARLAAFVRKFCRERNSSPVLPYLYVSAAVEIRALWLYSLHDELLKKLNLGIRFTSVLGEEDAHVKYIFSQLSELDEHAAKMLSALVRKECVLFSNLFTQLAHEFELHLLPR